MAPTAQTFTTESNSPILDKSTAADSSKDPEISLQELLNKLSVLFESNEVDVDALKQLMGSYRGNPSDWIRYINLSHDRYTRVLVDSGNGKYNLMLLCWPPTLGSTIHNHPDSHCIMKILGGSLSEVRYSWPNNVDCNDESKLVPSQMEIAGETRLDGENSVAYINDSIGLHRVVNRDEMMPAFSLHLYCPPFNHCRVFDEKTGQHRQVDVSFDPEEIAASNPYFKSSSKYKYLVKHQIRRTKLNQQESSKKDKDVLVFERQRRLSHSRS